MRDTKFHSSWVTASIRYIADTPPKGLHVVPDVSSVQFDAARCCFDQADRYLYRCAFARSVRPRIAEDLASPNGKANILNNRYAAIALCESADLKHEYTHTRICFRVPGYPMKSRGKAWETQSAWKTVTNFGR